jgi:NodT family efflux transporter outer membrane factor (OMF) lipoprotein
MRGNKYLVSPLCGAGLLLALAGCAIGPDYHPVAMAMPRNFDASASKTVADKPVVDDANWWKALSDPQLNALIDRAIAKNPDLQIALDRLQEARVSEAASLSNTLPVAALGGATATGTGSDLTKGRADAPLRAGDSGRQVSQINSIAGFDADWELDIFGKYRRALEAAKYDTQAAAAARNNVLVSVIADVARAYIDLRAEQMQIAVLHKNADTLDNYLQVTQARYNLGFTNELDVTLAQRELGELKAREAPMLAQIAASKDTLAVLIGQFPEDMAKDLDQPKMVPILPPNIDVAVPADLLRRRPDIQQAERELAGATARIGVAEADLFPHVSILGGVGAQGGEIASLNPAFIWSVGPSISWAVLDFGALDAQVDKADLRAKEMLVQYKGTVLNAVREVDTSYAAYRGQEDSLANLGRALSASQKSVMLASQRYERGLTDALNIIDAERQEFNIETQYITAQQNAADQFISLYKALGGGWENYQSVPPIRHPLPTVVAAFASLIEPHDQPYD